MERLRDLVDETLSHFKEGARSVKAYSNDKTFIITQANEENHFWVTLEEPGFPKTKTSSLHVFFTEVFGIEAKY